MKAYFMMVVGAAVLSSVASVMSPGKWKKYIQLVTGIVILCCITAPVAKLVGRGNSVSIPDISSVSEYDENMHRNIVMEELKNTVETDIEERMRKEYNADIKASVTIDVNENNEIEGVRSISISGSRLSESAKRKLSEIYGVDTIYEKQ